MDFQSAIVTDGTEGFNGDVFRITASTTTVTLLRVGQLISCLLHLIPKQSERQIGQKGPTYLYKIKNLFISSNSI